jgi:hypothetical protein
MSRYLEALSLQFRKEKRIELFDECRIVGSRQVEDLSGLLTSKVIVCLAPAIVAGGAFRIGQLGSQSSRYQRFERLVNGSQADVGNLPADGETDLFGSGMRINRSQIIEDSCPLPRQSATGLFQGLTQLCVATITFQDIFM